VKGDKLIIRTPGGGGYGDPLKREVDKVLRDVRNGLLSRDNARKEYGVVINEKNTNVDLHETRKLREDRLRSS
jgi:N-methylhydantoinase B